METKHRESRRVFVKAIAAAGAGLSSTAAVRAAKARPPSEQVNVGLIGVGIRGYALHEGINKSEHARVGGIADVSEHYIDRIRPQLANAHTPVHHDYRRLLDDRAIEAIVIATPDHWHAQMAIDAMDAGKDVYVEKPLAHSLDEAIRVRDKARATKRITQVGYQRRTLDHFHRARQIVRSGALGDITQIQLWSSRNRETPPWRAYDSYNKRGLPRKSGPEHVKWDRFQANRPARPYDARRFFHWQCYEQYSTGIFGILMSHPLDVANLVMDLEIPETCSAAGGIYRYDDGRTVPDTCNALLNYPSRNLTISFVGSSNNAFFNQEAQYRGTQGTMELGVTWLRLFAENKKNALFNQHVEPDKAARFTDLRSQPVQDEPVDYRWSTVEHLDDFFLNVKSRGTCKAPIREAFKAMVAVAMAIESYKTRRLIRWDPKQERMLT